MRKEPILFAVVAVLGAWFVQSRLGSSERRAEPRGSAQDYEAVALPDVTRSAAEPERRPGFGRDFFSQPRDTQPLPPLGLTPPPLESLGALFPPSPWGPAPALHARFLRTAAPAPAGQLVAGLFETAEDLSLSDAVQAFDPDDPEQRAARIESFKRQFDWIYVSNYRFGQIRNEDRYRLAQREDDILFYEVDPATGQSRLTGTTGVTSVKRSLVEEFGFAATKTNELELGRLTFGERLSATDFERGLRFADRCVEFRHEAPRALEIAEEMYQLVEAVNLQGDPRPRLGLALCYQYKYDYERAYATYQSLLATGEGNQPRALARRGMFRAALRLDRDAEADLRRAVELARTDWEVRQHYGRFLMARGREKEALAQFVAAVENEPRGEDEEELGPRVRLRLDLAGALLANGRGEEALERFTRALAADPEDITGSAQVAAAGMGAAAMLLTASSASGSGVAGGLNGGAAQPQGAATPDAGFELLMTSGLGALRAGQFERARAALDLARRADPFRAYLAAGALSFLAESAGYPEEAMAFIEEAFVANPVDPWVLYQRGRILLANGDAAGAEQSFRAALDRELDYAPALEELGALMVELGQHDAAELYFERALGLDPTRAVTWSRRGFNFVQLGDLDQAKVSFERARVERPSLATAAIGLAWWHYATGDTQEALILFAQLEEDRRNEGAQDVVRVYAKAQGDSIRDHETKETWRDRFDREPGSISNGWGFEEGFGPEALLRDGKVVIEGVLERAGRTRVFQQLETARFLSFNADLTILPSNRETTNGIFISVERERGGQAMEAQAEILLGRSRDGKIQARVRQSSSDDGDWILAPAGPDWPIGEPVRVGIERVGDDLASTFTLYVAGEPVFTGLKGDGIQRSRQNVRFGVFSEGDANRRSGITMDDVEVVRRR